MIENPNLQLQAGSIDEFIHNFEVEKKRRKTMFKSLALLSLQDRRPTLMKVPNMPLLSPRRNDSQQKYNSYLNEELKKKKQHFYVPQMPDENDEEKAVVQSGVYCAYCKELCDVNNLRCKACANIFHIRCLFNHGYLSNENVSTTLDWACGDCNDLSRLLSEEEMIKLIDLFDQLDTKKDCFVKSKQYIRMKKTLYEEYGQKMSSKEEEAERKRFVLMDTDHSGSITWNEFINYEAPSLLPFKNKLELANKLTLKELIMIKRKFLSLDKSKIGIIGKEIARSVYIEYIKKLREKLGRPFEEHLVNCDKLFGISKQNETNDETINDIKVSWDEFIRKIAILVLFDRLNSEEYAPQFWKPGNWFSMNIDREVSLFKRQKTLTFFKSLKPKIPTTAEKRKALIKINSEKYIDVNYLMKNDIRYENPKFYEDGEFGSHLYVIKSIDLIDDRDSQATLSSAASRRKTINSSRHLPPLDDVSEKKSKLKYNLNFKNSMKVEEIITKKIRKNKIPKIVKLDGNSTPLSTKSSNTDQTTRKTGFENPILPKLKEEVEIPSEPSKPYVYNDFIKQMHENKRHLTNSSSLFEKKNSKKLKDSDRLEFKLRKDYTAPSAFTSVSHPVFSKYKSVSFLNNDIHLRNRLLEKISGRPLLESGLPELKLKNTPAKYIKEKYTQSLDGFKKSFSMNRKEFFKSNAVWSSIDEKLVEKSRKNMKSRKTGNFNSDSIDYGNLSSYTNSVNNFDSYENYKESSFLF